MSTEVELAESVDFTRLGELWRDLEARADGSFFQSWAWVGCEAAQRFPNPLLVQARENGVTVALGLFNRRRRFGRSLLLLTESGLARHDAVFVEHNGLLVEGGRDDALLRGCLAQVVNRGGSCSLRGTAGNVVLSGVPEPYVAAAGDGARHVKIRAVTPAPFIDLTRIRATGETYLAQLGSNTRYQLRRSRRRYEAAGPLALYRAASVEEAHDFLSRLAALHQRHWRTRGKPGAFANPAFEQFHRTLIARAFPCGAIDLLRISCAERPVGYLYNFRYRGTVYAYQSGFDYAQAERHQRPGLSCHHLAIEKYLAEGAARYDFLAGDDRYKSSLATGAVSLYWLELRRQRAWRRWRRDLFAGSSMAASPAGLRKAPGPDFRQPGAVSFGAETGTKKPLLRHNVDQRHRADGQFPTCSG